MLFDLVEDGGGLFWFWSWFFLVLNDSDDACAGCAGQVLVVPAGGFADPASAVMALDEVCPRDFSFAEVAFVVIQGCHAL